MTTPAMTTAGPLPLHRVFMALMAPCLAYYDRVVLTAQRVGVVRETTQLDKVGLWVRDLTPPNLMENQ